MQRKLIALDLDGTTLNSRAEITERTKAVIGRAQEAGHIVSIVTGRPNRMAVGYYDELKLKGPMINFNGALGYIPHKNWEHEYQTTFSRKIALDILAAKQRLGIRVVSAEGKTMALSDVPNKSIDGFFQPVLRSDQVLNRINLKHDPAAMTMLVDRKRKPEIVSRLEQAFGSKVNVGVWGGPTPILELSPKGISKAHGIGFLAKTYGIARRDIIAFGDEHNDEEMLDFAGLGVVMKNGTDRLKRIADDVTEFDNDHDGVARYLKKALGL